MEDKELKLITTRYPDGTPHAQYLASDLIKIANQYASQYRDWAIQDMNSEEWDRQYSNALSALIDGRLVKFPDGYRFTDGSTEKIHRNVLGTLTAYLSALDEYTPEEKELPSNAELFSEYVAKPLALNNPDEIKNYMPGGIHHNQAGIIISKHIKNSIFPKIKGTDREQFWNDFVAELENGIGDADVSFANRLGDRSSGQFLKAILGKKENHYQKRLQELKQQFINQGLSEEDAEQYAKEDLDQQLNELKKLRHQTQLKRQKVVEEEQKAQQEKEWLTDLYNYYKEHWFNQKNYAKMYVELPNNFELDKGLIKKHFNIFKNMTGYMFGGNPPDGWDKLSKDVQDKLKENWVHYAFIQQNLSGLQSGNDGSILYNPGMFREGPGVINVYDVTKRKFYTLNDIKNPVLQDVMKKWYETQKLRPMGKNPFMKNGGLIKKCQSGDSLTTQQLQLAQEIFNNEELVKDLGLDPNEVNKYRPVSEGSYLPMRGVDLLRGAATVGDVGLAATSIGAPGIGNLVAPIGGVITTGMHWLADGLDDNVSRDEMWKNLAINSALTGALFIPGGGSARLVKVAKTTKDAAKAAKALKWSKRLRNVGRVSQGLVTAAGASYGISGFNQAKDIFLRYLNDPSSVTQDEFRFLTNWVSVVSGTSINTQQLSKVAAQHFGDNNIGKAFNIIYDPVSIFSSTRRHVNDAVLRGFAKNTVEGGYDFINVDGRRFKISRDAQQRIVDLLSQLKNSSKADKQAIQNQILAIVKEDITGINATFRNGLKDYLKKHKSFGEESSYNHVYEFDGNRKTVDIDGASLQQLKNKIQDKTDTEIDGIINEWISENFATDINWPKVNSSMIQHEPDTEVIDFKDPNNKALLKLLDTNSRARGSMGMRQTPMKIGQVEVVNALRKKFGLQVSDYKDEHLFMLYNDYLRNKLGLEPFFLHNLEKLKYLDDIQETNFEKFMESTTKRSTSTEVDAFDILLEKKGGSINPLKELRQNFTTDTTNKFSRGGIVKAGQGDELNTEDEEEFENWYTRLWQHKNLKGWNSSKDKSNAGNLKNSSWHNQSGDLKGAFLFNEAYINSDKVGEDIQAYYESLDDDSITPEEFVQNYNSLLKTVNDRFNNEVVYGTPGAKTGNEAHQQLFASQYNPQNTEIYLEWEPEVLDTWGTTSWLRRGDRYEKELNALSSAELAGRTFDITAKNGQSFKVYKKANGELTLKVEPDEDDKKGKPQYGNLLSDQVGETDTNGNLGEDYKPQQTVLEDYYFDPYAIGLQKAYPELLDISRYLKNLRNNQRVLELGLKKRINLKAPIQLRRKIYGDFGALMQSQKFANQLRSKADDIAGNTINTEAGAATQLDVELKAQQQEMTGRDRDNQMMRQSANESQQLAENLYKYNKEIDEQNMDTTVVNENYKLGLKQAKDSANTTNYNSFSMGKEQRARQDSADLKEKIEKIRMLRLEQDKQAYLTNTPKIKQLYKQLYVTTDPEKQMEISNQIEQLKREYQRIYGPYFFDEYIRILLGDYSRGRLPSEVQVRTPQPTITKDTKSKKKGGKLYNHNIKKKGEDLKELRKQIRHNITTNQKALDNLSKATLLELKKMMDI